MIRECGKESIRELALKLHLLKKLLGICCTRAGADEHFISAYEAMRGRYSYLLLLL